MQKIASKKLACKMTFSEAQNPIPPPLHNVYVYTVYLFTHVRGGELNQREREGATAHKSVPRIPT
jgi:hypothetical protein